MKLNLSANQRPLANVTISPVVCTIQEALIICHAITRLNVRASWIEISRVRPKCTRPTSKRVRRCRRTGLIVLRGRFARRSGARLLGGLIWLFRVAKANPNNGSRQQRLKTSAPLIKDPLKPLCRCKSSAAGQTKLAHVCGKWLTD